MKKHNFMGEELTRWPPGFRFQPTDEELLFQYLRCKIFSLPLPASIIPEVHLSKLDPWELPGDSMEERYVFTRSKGAKDNKATRATRSGYWEVIIGSEIHIYPPPSQNLGMMIKGVKKTLVYHQGKSSNSGPTEWFIHEYSLALNAMTCNNNHMTYEAISTMEDWVICHVFMKQNMEEQDDTIMLDYSGCYSLTANNLLPCSSSSSSSNSIIEVSSNESQSDEETSYFM